MRVLLILVLLLSSIGMVRPAMAAAEGAHAAGVMADCHTLMVQDEAPSDSSDHPRQMAHTCPGCAVFAGPLLHDRQMLRLPLPRLAQGSTQPPSILSAPIPPPPQSA